MENRIFAKAAALSPFILPGGEVPLKKTAFRRVQTSIQTRLPAISQKPCWHFPPNFCTFTKKITLIKKSILIQIMRTFTLLIATIVCGSWLYAQGPAGNVHQEMNIDAEPAAPVALRQVPGTGVLLPGPEGVACATIDNISSASNIFSIILTESNPIAVDNSLNTILFVHRNNAAQFGGHSGNLRYDITTNGGTSWTSNVGYLNPASVNGTNAARYPNASIYNPPANTNPNNAYIVYQAPTVAATWNGYVSGVRRLNGTGTTENYNQPTLTNPYIPRSIVKGAPGVFWSIDVVWTGTIFTDLRVLKGTWNGTTDVVWTLNSTISPPYNTGYDGNPHISDFNIAFDPTGQIGWIAMLSHVNGPATNYNFYPVFYRTTNGGTTWTGPEQVDIGQLSCVSANISPSNFGGTAFDMDLTVDVNGNPHCVVVAANCTSTYSVFLTDWHAIMDVTLDHGVWNAVHIADVYRGRGTWGTSPNIVSLDMECQASRSDDGTKIFFAWVDADSAVALATANQSPNLYTTAYNVTTRRWTQVESRTACTADNGKILFPKMSPNVYGTSGTYKMPVAYAKLGLNDDPINPATFHYLDSLFVTDADFTVPQCSIAVSIATTDSITVCGSTVLDAGLGGQMYRWSTGAVTSSITVTTSGLYWVGKNQGCCTGGDTVYVTVIQPVVASYNSSVNNLTAAFTDQTSNSPTSWLWDFGDGATSTQQNPSHTYATAGTYTVCLTATSSCGSDSICSSVTVTCPPATAAWTSTGNGLTVNFTDNTVGSNITWNWAFGDGNFSTQQNPSHTYAIAGTYTACLAITDLCGSDTLCQLVTACNLPVAAFTFTSNLGQVSFTDGTSPAATSWAWDFGDGGSSSQQNPSHIYAASGTYTVCLIATDACGPDTICQSVSVNVVGLDELQNVVLSTFPNPVNGLLGIRVTGLPAGNVTVQLRNVLGQTLWQEARLHSGNLLEMRIDMSGMARGMYFVEIESEGKRWVQKVMRD
jgi:PKD repeat protein